MVTTHEIAKSLGRQKMADALGVGLTAISKYVVAGKFPASWYLVIKSLCKDAGADCPDSLFEMKAPLTEAS